MKCVTVLDHRGHALILESWLLAEGRTGDRGLTARPVVLAQLARTMRNDEGSMKIR